jgi:feruloyl esterase
MSHCSGGIGPNDFGNTRNSTKLDAEHNILSALEGWVEHGTAPAKLIGSGTVVGDPAKPMTRPLCPYPQTAHYQGKGDSNSAENFVCAVPAKSR